MDLTRITTPSLLLDKQKCFSNIKSMAEKAEKHNLVFRPHFKTHQSKAIGKWFQQAGVDKITVSSFKMAEYFSSDNWKDITVAFPVNIREMDTINSLAEEIQLNLTIENTESIEYLIKKLKFKVGFFIKIDTGYNRTGISFDIILVIDKILKLAATSNKLVFKGFLAHSGNTYQAKNNKQILQIHSDTSHKLSLLKNHYIEEFPNLIISTGDTPSCCLSENFNGIDEIRPGNFVFFDLMQFYLGSCNFDQIAVCMACPVVAKHQDRNEIIIYGGAIHFSKDYITIDENQIFGQVVLLNENSWEQPVDDSFLVKISQEHGTIKASNKLFENIKIGDLIGIIPVHSCLTANLMKEYVTLENEVIDHL